MSPSRTMRSETFDPSWSTPTTASLRGTTNPVTRTRSEKQALVDFVTMTSALFGVSFSSAWGRFSNQYQTPTSAATQTTAEAGLRYSESVIDRSIQTYATRKDNMREIGTASPAKQSGCCHSGACQPARPFGRPDDKLRTEPENSRFSDAQIGASGVWC